MKFCQRAKWCFKEKRFSPPKASCLPRRRGQFDNARKNSHNVFIPSTHPSPWVSRIQFDSDVIKKNWMISSPDKWINGSRTWIRFVFSKSNGRPLHPTPTSTTTWGEKLMHPPPTQGKLSTLHGVYEPWTAWRFVRGKDERRSRNVDKEEKENRFISKQSECWMTSPLGKVSDEH